MKVLVVLKIDIVLLLMIFVMVVVHLRQSLRISKNEEPSQLVCA